MNTILNKTIINIPDIERWLEIEGLVVCNMNETISLWQTKKSGSITHEYTINGIATNIKNIIHNIDTKPTQNRLITIKLDDQSKKQIEYFDNLTPEDSKNLIKHYEEVLAESEETNDNAIVK